jgi:hypothetical protein
VSAPGLTLPFGKHAGEPLDSIPTRYLRWLVEQQVCRGAGLRQAVADELARWSGESSPATARPAPRARRPAQPDADDPTRAISFSLLLTCLEVIQAGQRVIEEDGRPIPDELREAVALLRRLLDSVEGRQ